MLWNALLLPVAWSLHEAGRTPVALAVAVVAVASIGAAVSAPGRRDGNGENADGNGDADEARDAGGRGPGGRVS